MPTKGTKYCDCPHHSGRVETHTSACQRYVLCSGNTKCYECTRCHSRFCDICAGDLAACPKCGNATISLIG